MRLGIGEGSDEIFEAKVDREAFHATVFRLHDVIAFVHDGQKLGDSRDIF
jgi:hypothetical protein